MGEKITATKFWKLESRWKREKEEARDGENHNQLIYTLEFPEGSGNSDGSYLWKWELKELSK